MNTILLILVAVLLLAVIALLWRVLMVLPSHTYYAAIGLKSLHACEAVDALCKAFSIKQDENGGYEYPDLLPMLVGISKGVDACLDPVKLVTIQDAIGTIRKARGDGTVGDVFGKLSDDIEGYRGEVSAVMARMAVGQSPKSALKHAKRKAGEAGK